MEACACPLCGSREEKVVFVQFGDDVMTRLAVQYPFRRIVACTRCSMIRANPRLSKEETERAYHDPELYCHSEISADSEEAVDRMGRIDAPRVDWICKQMEERASGRKKMLEIGSWTGAFSRQMRDRGWDVRCVEPNPEAARVARESFGLEVINSEFSSGLFEPESFDLVVLIQVLEHFHDPISLLKQMREILAPTGTLLLEVPNVMAPHIANETWFPSVHLHYYSPMTLKGMLEMTGFSASIYTLFAGCIKALGAPAHQTGYRTSKAKVKEDIFEAETIYLLNDVHFFVALKPRNELMSSVNSLFEEFFSKIKPEAYPAVKEMLDHRFEQLNKEIARAEEFGSKALKVVSEKQPDDTLALLQIPVGTGPVCIYLRKSKFTSFVNRYQEVGERLRSNPSDQDMVEIRELINTYFERLSQELQIHRHVIEVLRAGFTQ